MRQKYFLLFSQTFVVIYLIFLLNLFIFAENHILEDVNKCVVALQEGDADSLDRTAGAIRGRAARYLLYTFFLINSGLIYLFLINVYFFRVCSVVTQEMDNYEPCIYTKRVLEAVNVLCDQGMFFRHLNNQFLLYSLLFILIYIYKNVHIVFSYIIMDITF